MRRLHERWREKLAGAKSRYLENRTREDREEYLQTLKVFTNLVVRDQIPEDEQLAEG
jgi:hypothetical protein